MKLPVFCFSNECYKYELVSCLSSVDCCDFKLSCTPSSSLAEKCTCVTSSVKNKMWWKTHLPFWYEGVSQEFCPLATTHNAHVIDGWMLWRHEVTFLGSRENFELSYIERLLWTPNRSIFTNTYVSKFHLSSIDVR